MLFFSCMKTVLCVLMIVLSHVHAITYIKWRNLLCSSSILLIVQLISYVTSADISEMCCTKCGSIKIPTDPNPNTFLTNSARFLFSVLLTKLLWVGALRIQIVNAKLHLALESQLFYNWKKYISS